MTEWHPIGTAPHEGEFLAFDPIANKMDVCRMAEHTAWGADPAGGRRPVACGKRWLCETTQMDGEYGPNIDEFHGWRATHWMPLPVPPVLS